MTAAAGGDAGAAPVTVITLTRARPTLLERAIESVRAQDYPDEVRHLVVVDDDPEVFERLRGDGEAGNRPIVHLEPRPPAERGPESDERGSVYPRLARLLNLGVRTAQTPWVAFLDDDNAYEPNHLRSLAACARETGSPAVHSARRMMRPDGTPYTDPVFPWAATVEEGARLYELMCERGVWVRGTNVLRDRVDPAQREFRNSTVMQSADPIFLVDQSLWMIRRDLLLENPIPEVWSVEDVETNTCPDDRMLEALVRAKVPIASSGLPTVRYYVGGISNGEALVSNP